MTVQDSNDSRTVMELQLWLSPAFPVGSFAYSHGLEWAVGSGRITNRASALAWLADLIELGSLRHDAILLSSAWRAVSSLDMAALHGVNEMALSLAGSKERYLETTMQGNAFLATLKAAWPTELAKHGRSNLVGDVAYPVAVGMAAAERSFPVSMVLNAFLPAVLQNLVSALVRLSVIGQTDGQRVLQGLLPSLKSLAMEAATSELTDLGGAAFMSDVAAMAHETQDTRLFRS